MRFPAEALRDVHVRYARPSCMGGFARFTVDFEPPDQDEMRHLLDLLTATDWLTATVLIDTQLTGQLTERVLPLICPRI